MGVKGLRPWHENILHKGPQVLSTLYVLSPEVGGSTVVSVSSSSAAAPSVASVDSNSSEQE